MSVIIRLQNLPWSANALDIRQYFRGLSIPEGGVHIVGGEQGDAFIAFSTDEDARQAMMLDGGKIKEVKIRLLLSSRTEMQKVIEQARQQSVTLQTFMQMPAPMTPLPSVPSMPSMMGQHMSQPTHSMPQTVQQLPIPNAAVPVSTAPIVAEVAPVPIIPDRREHEREQKERESDNISITSNKDKKDRRERSRSRDKDGDRRSKRERDRSRGRRDRDRDRNRRHRDRSNSRDRDRNDRNRRRDRRDRSRSRDRSHSRDRNSRDRERDSKRNSRDRRRDSTSIPKEENSKDIDDPIDVDAIPKQQPLLLPHLKMQQQNDNIPFASQMQRAKTPGPMRTMGAAPMRAATPGPLNVPSLPSMPSMPSMPSVQGKLLDVGGHERSMPGKLLDVGVHERSMPTSLLDMGGHERSMPGKMLDVGGHERWDLPATAHVMGNTQGNYKPLLSLSQGVRPLQPSLDASHLREIDNRHHLGGVAFPSDVLRPPLQSVGHDIGQTPFMKAESYRDISDRENVVQRGRENWQASPSRQGPEGNSRFPRNDRGGGFSNSQDVYANEEEYDGNKRTDYDYHSPRGNYRGSMRGMADFRRGFSARGRGLGPGAGHTMQNRGLTPNSQNEPERRNMTNFPSTDRRGQSQPFGRVGRTDSNAFSKDRYDNFDRSHANNRQFSGRAAGFGSERFPSDRYQNERSYDRQQNVASGMCVEIRNMPSEAGYVDIKRFFQGLHIGGRGIKLINDNHGNRVGIAYVQFFKREHKEQALTLTGKPMCGSPVEVLPLNDELFDKAVDSYVPQEEENNDKADDALETFVCLAVNDIPVYSKEEDLRKLFHDFDVDEIILLLPNDKKQNVAYAKFNKPEDAKKASRTLGKPTVGHKLVTITPCSSDQFQQAKKQKQDKQPVNVQERIQSSSKENAVISKAPADPRQRETPTEVVKPEIAKPPQISTDCILLKGLPDNANDRDILDFFSDVGLVPLRIHIMLDKFNKPTGDAFCEFPSTEEAARAITKHQMPLGKENVSVEALPRAEMLEALGLPLPQPEPLNQNPVNRGPRFQPPAGRTLFGSNRSVGLLGASPNAPNRMPLLGRHPHAQSQPQPQDIPVEGFGKPGCVLALGNVPFKAEVDEILALFRDFDVTRENIIRRFNDKGMPTGDARVSLNSPAEVQRALQVLRFRKIRDRQIFMKPL